MSKIAEPMELAHKAVQVAVDKQATDIVMLDLRHKSTFTDFFVMCCAASERQIKAILEEIDKTLTEAGGVLLRREGITESGWILLDFGDVIIHVFTPERRGFYQLEKIWEEAIPVLRVQ